MPPTTIKTLTLGLTLSVMGLAGCSAATAAPVLAAPSADTAAPVLAGSSATEHSSDSPVVVEGGDSESESPSPPVEATTSSVGSKVVLGDWEVTVTKVTKNANSAIKNANMFNDKPEGQYMLVEYKAKYVGTERKSDVDYDLSWSFTDAEQTVFDQTSVVTPADDKSRPTEARKGGTVKSDVAFDVEGKKITGGILSVESSDEYADFQL